MIKDVSFRHLRSWKVGKSGPAPQVVFEIASEETWNKDLDEKPLKYAQMGVQEYYAYDPHDPPLRRTSSQRLFGWHLDQSKLYVRAMPVGPDGRLWSPHLESFLVPEAGLLRLYDRHEHLRLTQAETETSRAEAEAKRADALAEKLRSLGIDPDQL